MNQSAGLTASKPLDYQYGHPGMYGASGSAHNASPLMQQQKEGPFTRGQRKRLNVVAMTISLFMPWLLFCAMFWTVSFCLRYHNPFLCLLAVGIGLCTVGTVLFLCAEAIRKQKEASTPVQFLSTGSNWGLRQHARDVQSEPTWLVFLFITCLVAWFLGVIGGDMNFHNNMEPYYDVTNLNTYPAVDPSRMHGVQVMDAGRIMFTRGSKLDLSRSVGFKNKEMYCVAPIVSGDDPRHMATFDFWAVGTNCCSGGDKADFQCGEFDNAGASAGLRLMRDDQRASFRLAVQQAEAAYNIKADHPLFFHWMQDPIAEVNTYMDEGLKFYVLAILAHFVLQFVLVSTACIAFSKMAMIAA